eukprot:1448062-Amphidinium_carterae.2
MIIGEFAIVPTSLTSMPTSLTSVPKTLTSVPQEIDVLDSELIIVKNIPETVLQRCREEGTRPPFLLRQSLTIRPPKCGLCRPLRQEEDHGGSRLQTPTCTRFVWNWHSELQNKEATMWQVSRKTSTINIGQYDSPFFLDKGPGGVPKYELFGSRHRPDNKTLSD